MQTMYIRGKVIELRNHKQINQCDLFENPWNDEGLQITNEKLRVLRLFLKLQILNVKEKCKTKIQKN